MDFPELPMPVLFLVFLWLFLLIGFVPLWKKARAKMRRLRKERGATAERPEDHWHTEQNDPALAASGGLSDYETLVLRRLAQTGGKGLSRRQLRAELFMDQAIYAATLESLHRRGMIGIALTIWRGVRFQLTRRGFDYAVSQGFVPILRS
ncbi:hypothetical protein C2E25_02575 [Geothermobacter hydrogeniphilus]|uniref:Uncharacterized protein n=1 Tax=Geothermobacter hydrogeniphilus TaxID=1969733 RepID=A0A2K2HDU0_9BACT|nr:hypothetical protein [Geothermobacter hydrogeniphilus]PNU21457.1 hypothetical protein C2E25_02575 [Geothermobacter hydrogeniphilus]